MKGNSIRVVSAGLAGGLVFCISNFLTFGLLGGSRIGQTGLLFNPATQSAKVIAVWKTIEPLPVLTQAPYIILLGWFVFSLYYAFLYRSVMAAWPKKLFSRFWRLTLIVWVTTFFFEFMGPFNLLHEHLQVQWIEFVFWLISSAAFSFVITRIIKEK